MRVQLDNGRTQVDIEVENGSEKFLTTIAKALKVLNYTEVDLIREFSSSPEEKLTEQPKAAPLVVNTPTLPNTTTAPAPFNPYITSATGNKAT